MIVGIDLGTTNCSISYATKDDVKLFCVEEKSLFPSILYLPQGHEVSTSKHYLTGREAVRLGAQIPSRLVHSAKSWLGTSHVGKNDAILPLSSDPSIQKISPIEALRRIIDQIRLSWNEKHPALEEQHVVLTVPASFDEKARRQVLEAMQKAGIKNFTFLEEPQAAFYNIMPHADFQAGDCILVCDIGGGTTDFSLIAVKEKSFERVLVGEHLLIGGDNIDHAIAYRLKERLNCDLSESEWLTLVQEARTGKEEFLEEKEIVLFSAGVSLIGSAKKVKLYRKDIEECLSEFFQPVSEITPRKRTMQGFGLPFDAEPNILLHLARFLHDAPRPTLVLFNGGQTKSELVQRKVLEALGGHVKALPLLDPEHAVSRGAALFGLASLGIKGQKIKAGSGRSYYLEVEGGKGVLLIPSGFEFGSTRRLAQEFILRSGRVQFNLYASQQKDPFVELSDEFSKQGELQATLQGSNAYLEVHLSEIGILEVRAISQDKTYTLEFSLDAKLKKCGILDTELFERMQARIHEGWTALEEEAGEPRDKWSITLIRHLFDVLERTPKFWNMAGFLLRPGTGHILDPERIAKVWKIILQESFDDPQLWIAIRRIAPGLTKGQQLYVKTPLFKRLNLQAKGREEQYHAEELVRTLASLELLEIKDKVKLGNALLECLEKGNIRPAYLWALGRLGARVPLFATASALIGKETVEKWLERLLVLQDPGTREWKLMLSQLARKTPVPHLDISESLRGRVNPEELNDEAREELIGDSLPLGIALLS